MQIKEEINKVIKETVAYRCDECGKEIRSTEPPEGWHHFRYGEYGRYHSESWWSEMDVCSVDCYFKCLEYALEHGIEEVDNMTVSFASSLLEFYKSTKS